MPRTQWVIDHSEVDNRSAELRARATELRKLSAAAGDDYSLNYIRLARRDISQAIRYDRGHVKMKGIIAARHELDAAEGRLRHVARRLLPDAE